ncbi:MAG: alanine--tRNA ligase [Cytophagales bacterium]|nr:alanine--tRNA ligase [Cytophagales bacterium]
MNSKTIREKFIEFFRKKGHIYVPSAPIVNKEDPALMFTNAGMNQFKDIFLGHQPVQHKRVTNTQRCLRVSGKHNDLEEVGVDTYHHTMFEMLGNWSFGDYFKEEAIQWAWELLTEVYQLPKERLYVTVFGGDDTRAPDQEAYTIWKRYIDEERILYGLGKDNFWEMGDTGPCGPSSEIHIDIRPEEARKKKLGKDLVNTAHPYVIEIWNLVFIQYNRLASGKLEQLPAKHVDTGMGFERLTMVIQGKYANYDTDIFTPLIKALAAASGKVYGQDADTDVAIRVVADHVRSVAFAIADGQIPTNNKAGYVIRRILRRAVRYGYTYLGFETPFMYQLVTLLAAQFEKVFPTLKQQQPFVEKIIQEEEASFLRTLKAGLHRLEQLGTELKGKSTVIDGAIVFELYDTYGFPPDLTGLIAKEKGLQIDEQGFAEAMKAQQDRSKKVATAEQGDWHRVNEEVTPTFVGYDQLEATSKIVKYRRIREKGKQLYQLVFDKTPFYPEGGGQVGDTGYLQNEEEQVAIVATKKENALIIHYTPQLPTHLNVPFKSVVNRTKRMLTANHHSATHLLHAALRQVLGNHVEQKGSLVNEQLLRFDFSHYTKLRKAEIQQIENIVNQKIRENIPLQEQRHMPIAEAKKMGATALFGEKYGTHVRVITFDEDFSVELCGGTHVLATGQLGFFKIISEAAVAAGVRRVEAVTATTAEKFIDKKLATLEAIEASLKYPKDPEKAVKQLLIEKADLCKALEAYRLEQISTVKKSLKAKLRTVRGMNVLIEKVKLPEVEAVKKIAFEFKNAYPSLFLVLAAEVNKKPHIAVMISEDSLNSFAKNAHDIVKELAKWIKGGGGGQPFFATAGGKDVARLEQVIKVAENIFQSHIEKLNA